MNKLYILLLAGAAIAFAACSHKLDLSKVPTAVQESFARQFPGAFAKWEKEDEKYAAEFQDLGYPGYALFEADGTMKKSDVEIYAGYLPAPATRYINVHYKDQKIRKAFKVTNASGEISYKAELKGKDLIFDLDGQFIEVIEK